MLNSIWSYCSTEARQDYITYLQAYGALTKLFLQKNNNTIPYLDSKFQETAYSKAFHSQNTDIGNTPHDIVSVVNNHRIGIGLKTWMNSKSSYQKVMQLKAYKDDIASASGNAYDEAYKISSIKNDRLRQDYCRLGLSNDSNIYHYVTREDGKFTVFESSYPTVDLTKIKVLRNDTKSVSWSDGLKNYKFTRSDSQVWMEFSPRRNDTIQVNSFPVAIMNDPFSFLLQTYSQLTSGQITASGHLENNYTTAYLPLYSYRSGEVGERSGLNAWNASPKNKSSNAPRPLGEVYIPVPMEFHRKVPNFFTDNIFNNIADKRPVEFTLILPNGTEMPARLTGDNLKNFQSGSERLKKPDGKRWGQSDLGNWLLVDVLGLKDRQLVTRKWLDQRGVDSVRLWHLQNDRSRIYLDFAPSGSFDQFISQ